jgi:hypothetical protein
MGKERTMKDQTKSGPDISKINPETVLAYGDNFMLRVDDQSRNHLLLDVEDPESGWSTMRIPVDVWHAVHQCGVRLFPLTHSSDEYLRDMSVATVKARKEMFRAGKKYRN